MRSSLDGDTVRKKSDEIFKKVSKTKEFLDAENVMVYMSLGNEVCADKLIKHALEMGKNVIVPVMVNDEIIPCKIDNIDNLKIGRFGIREPEDRRVWQGGIDLVIVPGVGFDKKGGRIGFGKGYYDRFLEKKPSKKIALAYSFQIVDDTFSGEHDIPMDKIITEEELICCE